MKAFQAIVRHLASSEAKGSVLATLVAVEGSSYRRPGARLLLASGGEKFGSISGGCLEEDVIMRAGEVVKSGQAELAVYDTTSENDVIWGVGLGCHGIVRVLIEPVGPRPAWALALAENLERARPSRLAVTWRSSDPAKLGTRLAADREIADDGIFLDMVAPPIRLVIFGAGDDAQPLARLAGDFGWRVTLADPRPAFAVPERFPAAEKVIRAPEAQLVSRADPGPDDVVVVMTHHYMHDLPVVRDLLERPLAYLGMLGPKKRTERILDDLAASGVPVTAAFRARLHAPVGLDLGGDAPEAVALSIVAEIQACLAGRDGRPLRERARPIHE